MWPSLTNDVLKSRILRAVFILDYLGVLLRDRGRGRVDQATRRRRRKYEPGSAGSGVTSRGGVPSHASSSWKQKERGADLLPDPTASRGRWPYGPLISDSDLQNCEIISLCYFKPPGFWWFLVSAQEGNTVDFSTATFINIVHMSQMSSSGSYFFHQIPLSWLRTQHRLTGLEGISQAV